MAKNLTEDAVRDLARDILGLIDSDVARAGVGQLTTFNQLGLRAWRTNRTVGICQRTRRTWR